MTAPAISARHSVSDTVGRLLALRIPLTIEVGVYAVIFALAFGFRFWDLGANALHHDESIHAQWSWDLARGQYTHNPIFHGPLYYHVQAFVFWLLGASDYTARASAAIFGMVLVGLPLLLRRHLGALGSIAAVAFIAFSPTIVYYSRFMREDIYMAVFILLMAAAMWRYMDAGRDRWLVVFALALAGAFATKEATFLMVAIFLLFTNACVAADLARATLTDRGTYTPGRMAMLTAGLFPYAWAIAALWPFLGRLRRSAAWDHMPRAGDVLIVLGTLTVPLLAPVLKSPLETIGIVNPGQLDWPAVCQAAAADSGQNRFAMGGIFLMLVAAVSFIGLQWRPRTWAIAAGGASLLYLTLMTTFWSNLGGLCSGPWGSLDYWLSQQAEYRGDQPWFYYHMLMPMYEFLPLVIAAGGIWWSTVRGNTFSRFLVFWIAGTWLTLSWAGEKMPWLNTHIALPTALLAAWTIQRAWNAWSPKPDVDRALVLRLVAIAAVAAAGLLLAAFLPGGPALVGVRWASVLFAAGAIAFLARPFGRSAVPAVLAVAVIGALSIFSVRTMVMAVYERGDVPKDMLIYTQSSPEIPRIANDIDQLARANGKGFEMPIAVDSSDSFSWPWAWYLRDYRNVNYSDFSNGVPDGSYDVMLVSASNADAVSDHLAGLGEARYANPEQYPHRWWFPERYKQAMAIEGADGACTASGGQCGPFRPWLNIGNGLHLGPPNFDTISRLGEGIASDGWLGTWFSYWRNHDPGVPPGSIDAYAYFPAGFDRETGLLSVQPAEPPAPDEDTDGRPSFGGSGVEAGRFFAPIDIDMGPDGNLYVIDRSTRRLQVFDPEGDYIDGVDVRGGEDAQSEPWGVHVAPDGTVIVADTFGWQVRRFNPGLEPIDPIGQAPDGEGEPGPYELFGPRDVIVDGEGNLWVTDTGHDRIQVYDADGEFVRTIGESGSGPGQFDEPVGLAIADDGTVLVADMLNSRVQLLSPDGEPTGEFAVEGWGGNDIEDKPYLAALDDGRIALSLPSINEVRIYTRDGTLDDTITGGSEPLQQPYGIVDTGNGTIWIVEGGSGRVRLFEVP